METKELIKNKAIELENNLSGLMATLERQNKRYSDSRLFNLYLGKCFGMCELLNELGMKKEVENLEWIYKYGI